MRRTMLRVIVVGGLVSLLGGFAVAQEKKPDATLKLTDRDVAIAVGFSWGKGTLSYKGKTYPFKVEGLSVGEVGISQAEAVGDVYNLKQLDDFNGNYTAAAAGATAAGGVGVTAMINQAGVRIEMRSTTQGASLKLAGEGIKLSLTK